MWLGWVVKLDITLPDYNTQGRRIRGDARDMSLPISSHYQTVPSNNFDQIIKYMYLSLSFQTHLKRHIIDIT